jgi:hypothetical protein
MSFVLESESLAEHYKTEKFALYLKFKNSRIRTPITCYETLVFQKMPLKTARLRAIINTWRRKNDTMISIDEMIALIRFHLHGPEVNGDEWPGMTVFTDDEDAVEWDLEHTLS